MNRALPLTLLLATPALAQTATVTVSHNDPDGIVEPGQTINVRVDVTWSPGSSSNWILFAGLAGDVLPAPTTGTSSNVTSIFATSALANLGQPTSGGVVGIDIANPPTFGFSGCYPWPPPVNGPSSLAGEFIAFDWTAPTDNPGPVTFAFTPHPAHPGVRLFPSSSSANFIYAETTFLPITLTVTPAPASIAALAFALIPRRRR